MLCPGTAHWLTGHCHGSVGTDNAPAWAVPRAHVLGSIQPTYPGQEQDTNGLTIP